MRKLIAAGAGAFLALTAIAPSPSFAMGLKFDWGPTKDCFDSKSPPMTVSAVPAGTKKLRFKMVDLQARSFQHGGGTVDYTGSGDIPYGAFRYRGPCPPSPHTYQFTVEALDAKGKSLGSASAQKRFP